MYACIYVFIHASIHVLPLILQSGLQGRWSLEPIPTIMGIVGFTCIFVLFSLKAKPPGCDVCVIVRIQCILTHTY